jgi:NADH:ubiquinone oxidoreductase subunit K
VGFRVGAAKEVPSLTIAGSITLIVIGAILKFGITWQPKNIDLQVIGLILMIAGVVGLGIAVALMVARRRDRSSAEVYEERRYTQPPS